MKKITFLIVFLLGGILKIIPNKILIIIYQIAMFIPTGLGVFIRSIIVSGLCDCGTNIYISTNVTLKNISRLKLGNNVSLHENCFIDAIGGIEIGNNVSIAHASSLISFEHTWNDTEKAIKYNPLIFKPIKIEEDVWIGSGVRILAGATISRRSVVAAGAVVKNKMPPFTIVAGVPAKPIKEIM